jgi:CubicO group peptidase (beta-lactamase class C family)
MRNSLINSSTTALAKRLAIVALLLSCSTQPLLFSQTSPIKTSPNELAGLWKAKKQFGPDARGPLMIQKEGMAYSADMMGRRVPVRVEKGELAFDLPGNQGGFRGKVERQNIVGHWLRPGTVVNGYGLSVPVAASPVILGPDGPNRWSGTVMPSQDEFTVYLMVEEQSDGTLSVLMRNPERDTGNQIGARYLIREGNVVKLMGRRTGQTEDRELYTGRFDPQNKILSLFIPNRGLTYDFLPDGDDSEFYRRGKNPPRYAYHRPPSRDDGWPSATLDEVNIDREAIEKVIQTIVETPEAAADTPQIHGIIIARHGKLVLEEYFHGFTRDMLHNTRSASKSMSATLVGAAMQAGAPLKLSSAIYDVINVGKLPPDIDPQKRPITLENLLMMSSGFFCDDNNESAPGREQQMWEQTAESDFYRFFLKLPMDRKPGEKAVYCGGDPNLAVGMVGRALGENPLYTFERLIAGPMKIRDYGWPLDRAGNPYGGGGMQFTLRDFAKFAQLMLNGGTWQNHRILSRDFVTRASSPLTTLGRRSYGYLWWVGDYPYKDRKVNVYWALGAGGQNLTIIPELDLVVATFSGSYFTRAYGWATGELIPRDILPAVRENSAR